MLKIPAYCLPLSNSETQVSSSFTCILQFKGTYSQGFSIERHCEHWLCPGTTSSGKILTIVAILQNQNFFVTCHQKVRYLLCQIFRIICQACQPKRNAVQVAPEALLEEKNFFLALGIHKPHQVPDKQNILRANYGR